jgi:hypothetical protein
LRDHIRSQAATSQCITGKAPLNPLPNWLRPERGLVLAIDRAALISGDASNPILEHVLPYFLENRAPLPPVVGTELLAHKPSRKVKPACR